MSAVEFVGTNYEKRSDEHMRKGILVGSAAVVLVGATCIATLLLSMFVALRFGISLLEIATSSSHEQPSGTAFFESPGGFDYKRIALIEPYQAIDIGDGRWSVDLQTESIRYQDSVNDITKLNVISGTVIVTYSPDTLFAGEHVSNLWFVIVPGMNVERGFTDEDEFLDYLNGMGIGDPRLVSVDALYEELVNKGYLEWFPDDLKR